MLKSKTPRKNRTQARPVRSTTGRPGSGKENRSSRRSRPLSKRQQEIVKLLTLGLPDKQIAARLHLSEDTVGSHLRALFRRYRVHSRTALVVLLLE